MLNLGFSVYDAAKVMGLAAYGNPERYKENFDKIARPIHDGKFEIDNKVARLDSLEYYPSSIDAQGLQELFGVRQGKSEEKINRDYKDIAAALQVKTDQIALNMIEYIKKVTGSKNLCLAGGVALNCVTNSFVFEQGPFTNLYVQPAPHDAGTALGAAYYIWNHILGNTYREFMDHAYLGPEFSDDQIEEVLQRHALRYERPDNIEKTAAELISQNYIIGFFQGKMELGPRALGNRSILADPRNPDMLNILNYKVKHREYFRPLAPSVLYEEAGNCFDIKKETCAADFMLMAYPVKQQAKDKIPAVVHVDGSSRIQRVRKETNPIYHKIISEFYKITGVPMVLNTSFNDREPIVCGPCGKYFYEN